MRYSQDMVPNSAQDMVRGRVSGYGQDMVEIWFKIHAQDMVRIWFEGVLQDMLKIWSKYDQDMVENPCSGYGSREGYRIL